MRKTPLFHKGHYNIIAAQFKRQIDKMNEDIESRGAWMEARKAINELAISMTLRFEDDNPAFDSEKFLQACGVI